MPAHVLCCITVRMLKPGCISLLLNQHFAGDRRICMPLDPLCVNAVNNACIIIPQPSAASSESHMQERQQLAQPLTCTPLEGWQAEMLY